MRGSTPTTRTVLQSHMPGGSISPRALVAIGWIVAWTFVASCWQHPFSSEKFWWKTMENPWNPTFSSSIFWLTFWPLVSLCGFTLYGTNISHLGKGPFMFLGRDSLSSTGQTCHFNKAMFPLWEMFSNWKERYKAMLGVAEGRCWKVVKPFLLLKDSKTFKKSISAVSQILCPPRLLQANKYTK